jgi:glycosyltransferase involved in cell wall biosynthesis
MKILFLSSWFPYPPDNGSRIRVFNLIRQLARVHDVKLLAFSQSGVVCDERIGEMRRYCAGVDVVPRTPFRPNSLRSLVGFFSARPRSFVDTYSHRMAALVEAAARERFDVVLVSEIDAAPYAMAIAGTPRILEDLELTVVREKFETQKRLDRRLRYGLTWWKTRRFTARLLRQFDGCTVVSEGEREDVRRIAPAGCPVVVVPNGVAVADYVGDFGPPQRDTLVFPGALTYDANFDAMAFFLEEIFPLIRAQLPEATLRITGTTEGVPTDQLPLGEGVTLTGYLEDVRPTVAHSWACVVPLRHGAGTRLKILEAMALGTPVVATSKGAEGLAVTPGEDILIADDPADFAARVVALLGSPALRDRIRRSGRRLVRERYDWDVIGRRVRRLIDDTIARAGGGATAAEETLAAMEGVP